MINKAILIGRLTDEVELKYTPTGKQVANFTIAVNGYSKEEKATFLKIVAWERIAENCKNYLSKGSLVYVEGKISIRSYDAKDGTKRWVTEIIAALVTFIETKKQQPRVASEEGNDHDPENTDTGYADAGGEEVPF